MFTIEADVFSGRENPRWLITDEPTATELLEFAASRPEMIVDAGQEHTDYGLGFRGLIIDITQAEIAAGHGLPARFRIAGGTSRDEASARDFANRLLDALPGRLQPLGGSGWGWTDQDFQRFLRDQLRTRREGGGGA